MNIECVQKTLTGDYKIIFTDENGMEVSVEVSERALKSLRQCIDVVLK